jgi:plasmid stability protein
MHNACMSTLIQIRNVPQKTHDKLKVRAASQGKSLNSYMLEIVEREVERPTFSEVVARIRSEGPPVSADDRR